MTSREFMGPQINPSGTAQYLLANPPIYFEVIGKGKPVVLLHGAHTRGTIFADLVKEFAESYQLIIPDLPGHGFSGGSSYSHELANGQIIKILDALKLKKVDVVGYSLGAQTAQELIAEYPDRFQKVVLIQPFPPQAPFEAIFSFIPFMAASPLESTMNKDLARHKKEEIRSHIKDSYRYARYPAVDDTIQAMKAFEGKKFPIEAEREILILGGSQDSLTKLKKLNQKIPNSILIEIPEGYRSNLLYEKSSETAEIIKNFLGGIKSDK